jgi:hypothetical protein
METDNDDAKLGHNIQHPIWCPTEKIEENNGHNAFGDFMKAGRGNGRILAIGLLSNSHRILAQFEDYLNRIGNN